jgi:hypothetical protein
MSTKFPYDRKKLIDENAAVLGLSCEPPFDPETVGDAATSNRTVDNRSDLDSTSVFRDVDGDVIRDEHFAEEYEGRWLCRGLNWD